MTLTSQGLPLQDIYNLPLDVFMMFNETALRLDAGRRLRYITDTSAAVANILSSKSGVKEYTEGLTKMYQGEGNG